MIVAVWPIQTVSEARCETDCPHNWPCSQTDCWCVCFIAGDALLHTVTGDGSNDVTFVGSTDSTIARRSCPRCADAILGALCQPDIGQLFPDSDPKWKGQTSDVFVREAVSSHATFFCVFPLVCVQQCLLLDGLGLLQVRLMHEHGYVLGNLDATIILQRPKLSPHKEAIRANLCKLLDAHPSVINIKVRVTSAAGHCWCVRYIVVPQLG